MPRRISDYPDAFAGWNSIASLGSLISISSSIWFFIIVYLAFVEKQILETIRDMKDFIFFIFFIIMASAYLFLIFSGWVIKLCSFVASFFYLSQWLISCFFWDAPRSWQLSFQDPATSFMEGIIDLHHDVMFFLIVIISFVSFAMLYIIFYFNVGSCSTSEYYKLIQACDLSESTNLIYHRPWYRLKNTAYFKNSSFDALDLFWRLGVHKSHHNSLLEQVWTITPAIILGVISVPSFSLLYSMDEIKNSAITLKVIGHQWYWGYEFPNHNYSNFFISQGFSFESRMLSTSDILDSSLVGKTGLRLLEVDHVLVLPIKTSIRLLVTAADVLHSWAIPSLGIKVDACPGRLNQVYFEICRPGCFYGQCSEICWRLDRTIWGIPNEFTRIPDSLGTLFDVIVCESRESLKRTLIKMTIVWTSLNSDLLIIETLRLIPKLQLSINVSQIALIEWTRRKVTEGVQIAWELEKM